MLGFSEERFLSVLNGAVKISRQSIRWQMQSVRRDLKIFIW